MRGGRRPSHAWCTTSTTPRCTSRPKRGASTRTPLAALVDEDGRLFLLPLLLRRVCGGDSGTSDAVSPYGYPGLLLNDAGAATDGFADACLTACSRFARCGRLCRFRPDAPTVGRASGSTAATASAHRNRLTVSIDLEQPEHRIWATMSKGHTNAINKAKRFGYRIEISPASTRIEEFAVVYADNVQRLGATTRYQFSTDYLRQLAGMDEAFVAVAMRDDVWPAPTCCSKATASFRCISADRAPNTGTLPVPSADPLHRVVGQSPQGHRRAPRRWCRWLDR